MSEKKVFIDFDYKNPINLYRFLEGGKIGSIRNTGLNQKDQKNLCSAIKKARTLGLLPIGHQNYDDYSRPALISPKSFKI